jgi:hypothetical protein
MPSRENVRDFLSCPFFSVFSILPQLAGTSLQHPPKIGGNHLPFEITLLFPSREGLRADVDEAFVVGAGALDEELLALRPAVEIPDELGVTVR